MTGKRVAVFMSCIAIASCGMTLVVYDNIVSCDEYPPKTDAGMFDMSTIQLIPENDTHTFFNGTLRFKRDLKKGWGVRIYTEHKVQGEWALQAFDRRYPDLCQNLNNPLEPFYPSIRDKKKCPLSAGDEWVFNMFPMELKPELMAAIPHHYAGEWRVTLIGIFDIDGEKKYECKRGFADLFEV